MEDAEKIKILLVDDNEINQVIWATLLEGEGYGVLVAQNGQEALALATNEHISLILLDVRMPGMCGFEVLESLRKDRPSDRLPVIMATSLNGRDDIVRAFELGANDYIAMPPIPEVALARIEAQLKQQQLRSERLQPNDFAALGHGTVLEGKYRLERLIGSGNYGSVYRATDLELQRPLAVKVLHWTERSNPTSVARFQQEGISLAKLQHPNVVRVFDLSVAPKTQPYMIMELLDGVGLERELEIAQRLSPARSVEIMLPVCDVLQEAHSHGIIHRDIKPNNIFLHHKRQHEVVKVLDFGVAKLAEDLQLQKNLTAEGNSLGTPAYMAPERLTAEPYDGRTDVYSAAATLYEMLSGETPFASAQQNLFKLIYLHCTARPKSLVELVPETPSALDAAVQQGLSKSSCDRPTASEFSQLLLESLA